MKTFVYVHQIEHIFHDLCMNNDIAHLDICIQF
jgi:hypothetical protein